MTTAEGARPSLGGLLPPLPAESTLCLLGRNIPEGRQQGKPRVQALDRGGLREAPRSHLLGVAPVAKPPLPLGLAVCTLVLKGCCSCQTGQGAPLAVSLTTTRHQEETTNRKSDVPPGDGDHTVPPPRLCLPAVMGGFWL